MRLTGVFLFILCFSCKPAPKGQDAIKDFRKKLQPDLTHIVTKGFVDEVDAEVLAHQASLAELERLARCEHPLLRAAACLAMLQRKDADHLEVINFHLDDTALISVDRGEWGLAYKMVSDELLFRARWKTEADRWKTTDSVFMHHDYLEAAYFACDRVEVREQYYPFIKEMVQRDVRFLFERKESALYGLARFGKKEDIPLIRDILIMNHGSLGYTGLRLMQEFPDTAYMEVFNKLYPRWFNRRLCSESIYSEEAVKFIDAVASYRSDSSARILGAILHRKPFSRCNCDSNDYKRALIWDIWNNPCPAYLSLRRETETAAREIERRDREDRMALGNDTGIAIQPKPTDEPVRWW
ncbi:MAG TPA: hypothetical protein VNW04_05550 [Puia sp.]|jgi:hypothetical protein|nr:hypothetical protein [Puia sp.]